MTFCRNFKADAQPKGPPMGSNPASNNSSQPLSNRMGANNNLNPGFNMMQPSSTSTNNQMVRSNFLDIARYDSLHISLFSHPVC